MGEPGRAIAAPPDDAWVEAVASVAGGGRIGASHEVAPSAWGPDALGFSGVRIEAVVPWGDLVASEAIAEVPAWILERVPETGSVPTRGETGDWMHG